MFFMKKRQVLTENYQDTYEQIVANYLKLYGSRILDVLCEYCERRNGVLTYEDMQIILGKYYPKPLWIDHNDEKSCMIAFISATGLPFKFTRIRNTKR